MALRISTTELSSLMILLQGNSKTFIWPEMNAIIGVRMDESIFKMKDLLEKGYKIVRIHKNYTENVSGNILQYQVTLEMGPEKEVICSSSNDFVAYMKHFKKIKNKFNNDEFIYVDDLGIYKRQTRRLIDDQVYIEDKHLIKIMSREFKEGITTLLFKPGSPANKTGIAKFRINLEINPEFLCCDLKDEFKVYEKSSNKLVFTGLIKHCAIQEDNTALIIAQDATLELQNTRLSAEFINMNPVECASTITLSMGLDFHTDYSINTNERTFIVIIPLKNLIISDDFKIGNVEFYQEFITLDDLLIRKSENGRTNPEWNGNYPRAKIIVNTNSFLTAIKEGYKKISTAIDIISLRTDISFPRIKIKDRNMDFVFDYYIYLSKVKIPSWVYCREKDTNSCMFFNIEFVKENVLALEYRPQHYFSGLNDLFGKLLTENEHTQQDKNILQVLHWLRRSIQTGENKDKLLDLWTAIEFLVSDIEVEKIFSKDEIGNMKKIIEAGQIMQYKQKEVLFNKLDLINQAPIMEKIRLTRKKFDVKLTREENEILRLTRGKRNDLIHGKEDIDIKGSELNKLRSIIELLLIGKISNMHDPVI
jgi:hypothetical protein